MRLRLRAALCALACVASTTGAQQLTPMSSSSPSIPAPSDTPYAPGTIRLEIDATNLGQRIFRVRETIPVRPGTLTLLYPMWVPGGHTPRNPIDKIAGITFRAGERRLEWKRDPLQVAAFHVEVPGDVREITAAFDFLTPTRKDQGRVVMTAGMLNLQFISAALYPAGHHVHQILFDTSVTYPQGWTAFTALHEKGRDGSTIQYEEVPFDILVDSPVYAGSYAKDIDLTPAGSRNPVRLGVIADAPKYLEAKPEQVKVHQAMVEQAIRLFGAQHYDHYRFLLSLSEQMGGIGLEHQRSSENGEDPQYFTDWKDKVGFPSLLAHEYAHSWNGKYRRPADLWTPNFNVPMQDSLLWVYEGQTQYWGNVLAGRSGMRPLQASIDAWAQVAATYADNRLGLGWRSLQDTTNDPIIASRAPRAYRNWQMSEDYYGGGQMLWLEVDALIRSRTRNRKSLDDFARTFFGQNDGEWKRQSTYTFDDVVEALDGICQNDWKSFLRERLDGKVGLTGGIEASGWRLVYRDAPSEYAKSANPLHLADFTYSLGLTISKDDTIADVRWDSPAFNAGLGTGASLIAVNGQAYSEEVLQDAVKAAKGETTPIELLVKEFDRYRTVAIDYHEGLRYPHLERIPGTPDRLTDILTARK